MKRVFFLIVMFGLLALDTLPKIDYEPKARIIYTAIRPTIEQQIQLKRNELIRVNSKIEVSLAEIKNSN